MTKKTNITETKDVYITCCGKVGWEYFDTDLQSARHFARQNGCLVINQNGKIIYDYTD